uniref:Decapping nuclease n=1 Tax=Rhabditophanes sp. KR3021 TaxID=114890 RepID=A0AC35U9R9_9BILA
MSELPNTLYMYNYNKNDGVTLGLDKCPVLKKDLRNGNAVNYDLKKNSENLSKRTHSDMTNSTYESIIKYKATIKSTNLRCDLGGADIVTWRGFLAKIYLIFCGKHKDKMCILARRYNGVIFLENFTEKKTYEGLSIHMGHMYENYITEDAQGNPNDNKSVDTSDVNNIVQTRVFKHNDKSTIVCYIAENDARKSQGSKEFIEAKTHPGQIDKHFYTKKGHSLWIQSYLTNVDEIIVGLKKCDTPIPYIVEKNVFLKVEDIRQRNNIDAHEAMGSIAQVLIDTILATFSNPETEFAEFTKPEKVKEFQSVVLSRTDERFSTFFPEKFLAAYPKEN